MWENGNFPRQLSSEDIVGHAIQSLSRSGPEQNCVCLSTGPVPNLHAKSNRWIVQDRNSSMEDVGQVQDFFKVPFPALENPTSQGQQFSPAEISWRQALLSYPESLARTSWGSIKNPLHSQPNTSHMLQQQPQLQPIRPPDTGQLLQEISGPSWRGWWAWMIFWPQLRAATATTDALNMAHLDPGGS